MELFDQILPRKFAQARGAFIIDSKGKISKEVDIVIYDEQFSPFLFDYNVSKIIPIEAVLAVVQCKSTGLKTKELCEWSESINLLESEGNNAAIRMANGGIVGNSNRTTKPFKFLCTINSVDNVNEEIKNSFDFIIKLNKEESKMIFIDNINEARLKEIESSLDNNALKAVETIETIKSKKVENTILNMKLILNQYFMFINNPMLFDYVAYANFFGNKENE